MRMNQYRHFWIMSQSMHRQPYNRKGFTLYVQWRQNNFTNEKIIWASGGDASRYQHVNKSPLPLQTTHIKDGGKSNTVGRLCWILQNHETLSKGAVKLMIKKLIFSTTEREKILYINSSVHRNWVDVFFLSQAWKQKIFIHFGSNWQHLVILTRFNNTNMINIIQYYRGLKENQRRGD